MGATDYQLGRQTQGVRELALKNASGADILLGTNGASPCVKIDSTAANQVPTSPAPCFVKTAAATDMPCGALVTNAKNGKYGRVQTVGLVWMIADGAIAFGAIVGPSATTAGDVTTYTAGDAIVGQAWSIAANAGDPVLVHLMLRAIT